MSSEDLVAQAVARADDAREGATPAKDARPERWWVVGDPQAPFAQLAAVLAHHHAVGDDGWLRPDVGIVSIGDHFDYGAGSGIADRAEREAAGREGERVLSWLAAHSARQVEILLGNHDLARVQELASISSDDDFASARLSASTALMLSGNERAAALAEHGARFPGIPTPGLAARDFSTFTVSQRRLVQRLLCARRYCAALVGRRGDREVLLVHTPITAREIGLLALPDPAGAASLATSLQAALDEAVDRVAARWTAGENVALDLSPLHCAGVAGEEAGGWLASRPANPDRAGDVDRRWENDPGRPRRFHPDALPRGLVQISGHTTHRLCVRELAPWVDDEARTAPAWSLRTLTSGDGEPRYRAGIRAAEPNEACVYLVDASMHASPANEVPLLEIDAVVASRPDRRR